MKKLLIVLLSIVNCQLSIAEEGLWLPSQISGRIEDMRRRGFRLKADDLYSTDKPALNRAVVMFGGGCTGAIVSPDGLVFTNHHCGYGQIVSHSTPEHDYLTNGFWAMSRAEELPGKGLQVRIMVRMENVTADVAAGQREVIIERAEQNGRYKAEIKSLYHGGEQWLWVYEVFRDVRLVGAPPSAIGKFGGDTDNWMWPRHTGDFSVFRIYAAADGSNRPADYSPDNVPYKPARHFEIASKGVREGDFTMVYGFPGTTREYVVSSEINYITDRSDPMKIAVRTRRLDAIKAAIDADPSARIELATRQASIANAWKKWQGESWGLLRRRTAARKQIYEERFRQWASPRPHYAHLIDSLYAAYSRWEDRLFLNELLAETAAQTGALRGFRSMGAFAGVADVTRWYTSYMQALREFDPERKFYPDANLTLRISYGAVEGYADENGAWHKPFTDLDGVMDKDDPAIYDYDIPVRLRELFASKDYGRWAVSGADGPTVPVCFLASNHTSGGNSGSPVLNARGELMGLNFDRTWLGTMSDLEFSPDFCRNISVDIRYVLFVIEKVGGAEWIIKELDV